MNAKRCMTLWACLGLFVCLGGWAGEDAQPEPGENGDMIERVDKKTVPPTKIVQDDYLYVIGKLKAEIKVKSFEVKNVTYSDADPNYSRAVTHREDGRYTVAAIHFHRALEAMKTQPWAAEYCNYGLGDSFYSAGIFKGYKGKTSGIEYPPASVYFKKVLELKGKSRFMPDVVSKLPVCLAEEGKFDEAEAALKDGDTRIKDYRNEAIKIAPGYAEIADRAIGRLALARARIAELKARGEKETWANVADAWRSARSQTSKFPDMMADSVDGILRALVKMQDFNGAKAEASGIIEKYKKDNDTKMLPLLPGAYTALGKAHMMQGLNYEGKGQKIQANTSFADARWNFLHVVGQFFDDDEYVAGAHYFAGVCYDKLKEVEKLDASEKAIRHWKLVIQSFPKSEFREQAEKALKEAGVAIAPAKDDKAPVKK